MKKDEIIRLLALKQKAFDDIKKFLKQERKAKVTLQDLCRLTGIPPATIYQITSDLKPSLKTETLISAWGRIHGVNYLKDSENVGN